MALLYAREADGTEVSEASSVADLQFPIEIGTQPSWITVAGDAQFTLDENDTPWPILVVVALDLTIESAAEFDANPALYYGALTASPSTYFGVGAGSHVLSWRGLDATQGESPVSGDQVVVVEMHHDATESGVITYGRLEFHSVEPPPPDDWYVGWIRWGGGPCLIASTSSSTVAPGGDVGQVNIFFDSVANLPSWLTVDDDSFVIDGDLVAGFDVSVSISGSVTSSGDTEIAVTVATVGVQSQDLGTPGTDVPFSVGYVFSGLSAGNTYEISFDLIDLDTVGATLAAGAAIEICLTVPG